MAQRRKKTAEDLNLNNIVNAQFDAAAKLVKLPGGIATIVVGNPLIADVTLQNGGVVVVTGKGYGATNFIALDRTGQVLVDRQIQVEGPLDRPRDAKQRTEGIFLWIECCNAVPGQVDTDDRVSLVKPRLGD